MRNAHQTMELMRGAIALNNAAISLLERGHATKALRVFRTVVSFLQESTKTSVSSEKLRQELYQAASQVASAKRKVQLLWEVQVVDDDDDAAKYEATVYGPSSSIGFVLRLGNLYTEECTMSTFQYLTTSILCNFALAYRCGYVSTKCANLLVGAAQTLRTAKFLLLGSAQKTDDLYELYRWQVLLSLLRQTTAQVSRDAMVLEDKPSLLCAQGLAKLDDDATVSIVDPEEAEYIKQVYRRQKIAAPAA